MSMWHLGTDMRMWCLGTKTSIWSLGTKLTTWYSGTKISMWPLGTKMSMWPLGTNISLCVWELKWPCDLWELKWPRVIWELKWACDVWEPKWAWDMQKLTQDTVIHMILCLFVNFSLTLFFDNIINVIIVELHSSNDGHLVYLHSQSLSATFSWQRAEEWDLTQRSLWMVSRAVKTEHFLN